MQAVGRLRTGKTITGLSKELWRTLSSFQDGIVEVFDRLSEPHPDDEE